MSVLYVDSSALLKRVIVEAESEAVRALLRQAATGGDLLTASSIAWLEVWRSLRRADTLAIDDLADAAMSGIAEFPISGQVLTRARRVGDDGLRSLDALHLASAIMLDADVLVTYDDRLASAASLVGIAVAAPR